MAIVLPTVRVYPREPIVECKGDSITGCYGVVNPRGAILISISTPTQEGYPGHSRFPNYSLWEDSLKLKFDDWSGLGSTNYYSPFTKFQAVDTLAFILKHQGKDFDIHCDAGVSRSAAVGKFIVDNLGSTLYSDKIQTPNKRVLEFLNEQYRRHLRTL